MKRIGFHASYARALLVLASLAAHRALAAKSARTDREVTSDILPIAARHGNGHRRSRSGPNVA